MQRGFGFQGSGFSRYLTALSVLSLGLLAAGCGAPKIGATESYTGRMERHAREFGRFRLPEQVGVVENIGLQLPAVSPDGEQVLYLRLDAPAVSPMTLLGSSDAADTPGEGTLTIWLRPARGTSAGRRLSTQRWAHSAVWSASGRAIAYVANEPPGSRIVHHDLASGRETSLGVPGAVNCLPRFDGDDRSLLFCSGASAAGPFRVFRQCTEGEPAAALTPAGQHCVLPVLSEAGGKVLCARASGHSLHWARAGVEGTADVSDRIGNGDGPGVLALWAGIAEPVSPDRKSVLFYEAGADRIAVYNAADKRLARHRTGSVAACWINNESIALATPGGLFVVHAFSGVSLSLMSGAWVPARFVPESRTLVVLGKGQTSSRLSIYAIGFEPPEKEKS